MKKFICLLILFIITGCTGKSVGFSLNEDSDSLWDKDYLESTVFESDLILEKSFSISFWYKSDDNKTGTSILGLGDSDNYIKFSTSGFDGEVYSGLTLYDDNDNWVVADGINTIKTGRFNYIVLNIKNNNADIYLNGEKVASGKIDNDLKNNEISFKEAFYSNILVSTSLIGEDTIKSEYNKKLPNILLDTIKIRESDDMVHDYWLDSYEIEGYPVKWTSNNQEVIDFRGVILKEVEDDTTVVLTATMEIDGNTASKEFEVIVRKNDENRKLIRDADTVSNYLDKVMFSGNELPTVLNNGSNVVWRVTGNAVIENNRLVSLSDDKENITLTATISNGNNSVDKSYDVILNGKAGGYIMSYFNGELGEEKGKLAYSYDGLNWTKLNIEVTSNKGTGRVRDPFISRDENGNFVILATEGFDNPSIYVFRSNNLLDFNDGELIQVAYLDDGIRMTGQRAWAPEFTYDLESGQYYMYFSDNGYKDIGGPIFATVSEDLNNYSYPFIYFDPGYSVIDGNIIKVGGYNYLFYKDERKASQSIFYAESSNLSGFSKAYDEVFLNLNKYMEGPFTFKDINGGYFIYMDNYPNETFYAGHFNELGEENDIEWLEYFSLPEEVVRHGSVVLVSEKELKEIIEMYR